MADIENLLVPHMNMSLSSYVEHSNMINNGVWGSDIEIFAASSMLSTDIYVYTKTGEHFTWQKFSRSMLDGSSPKNKCAIYLQHTNGLHYDVVLDVCSTMHGGTPKNESRSQRKSEGCSKVKHDCFSQNKPSCKMKISENKTVKTNVCNGTAKNKNPFDTIIKTAVPQKSNTNKKSPSHFPNKKQKFNMGSEKTEPLGVCHNSQPVISIHAEENTAKFHKSIQFAIYHCVICQEAWPLNAKSKPSSNYTCGRCSRDKKVPQKFSAQNFIIPSSVPAELQNLTQIEEMLLARALPIMKVFTNVGGQRGSSGHCINLPQKVEELAQSLPRCPKDIPMIIVTMKARK